VLNDPPAGTARAAWEELWAATAIQYRFEILAVEGRPDHVHLIGSAPFEFAPAEIIRLSEGVASRGQKKEFESLRRAQ